MPTMQSERERRMGSEVQNVGSTSHRTPVAPEMIHVVVEDKASKEPEPEKYLGAHRS